MEFTSFEKQVFNWIILAIGVVAVLCNCLLVRLARRLHHRTVEIRLAVVLACIDISVTLLTISGSLLNNWYGNDLNKLQQFCHIKGPVDFVLQYSSSLAVAVIAMVRFSKVRGTTIPVWVWIVLGVCAAAFAGLVLVTALRSEFYPSPSGVDCIPIGEISIFSSAVLFSLGLFMFLSLAITLFCYLCILGYVRGTSSKVTGIRKHVLARVTGICVVYLLLVAPSSVLIMMQAIFKYEALNQISLATTFLVDINTVANACITLFAHSLIFGQLRLPSCRRMQPN
ncbi:hypothetical protein DSO57_1032224 [Entomophthora muscae]|uniref:Uncharacterized protein n=1 Tax=Entomophthora muscae TaxID=34485 RepID=A0ACC2SPQ4_9FUNG|nr:hypothetical protein DSO57_1032224 [Entomophthora muscae]